MINSNKNDDTSYNLNFKQLFKLFPPLFLHPFLSLSAVFLGACRSEPSANTSSSAQRYKSSDLYKPRLSFGNRRRRRSESPAQTTPVTSQPEESKDSQASATNSVEKPQQSVEKSGEAIVIGNSPSSRRSSISSIARWKNYEKMTKWKFFVIFF